MGKASRKRRERMAQAQQARKIEGLVKRVRFYDRLLAEQERQQDAASKQPASRDWKRYDLEFPLSSAIPVPENTTVIDASRLAYVDNGNCLLIPEIQTPVALPFDDVFIEMTSHDAYTLIDNSGASLVNSIGALFWWGDEYTIYGGLYYGDHPIYSCGEFTITLNEDDTIKTLTLDNQINTSDKIRAEYILCNCLNVIQFLNCRNIVTVDHEPDPVDNAAYQRHFGAPMTKYKTLAVKSMGKRYERDGEQQQFDVMPLHIRRGNFAHYTDDKPLFGKYTGTFWRPATAVGNAKNGVVVKDYKVAS